MRRLARLVSALLITGACFALAGCAEDDGPTPTPTPTPTGTPTPTPTGTPGTPAVDCPGDFTNGGVVGGRRNCILPRQIIRNLTLPNRAGTIYSLSGRVDVGVDMGGDGLLSGGVSATLTIEPGVTIFGTGGLDYLVVNRGSKLQAAGTAGAPIVFTSRSNVEGLADNASQGQWGGVVLLGRAPISDCLGGVPGGSAHCEQSYEGLSGTLYGGAVADDNSGTLQYIQIRYAGFELAPNQEINGLTLAGVGSGTVVDHIQIHNSSDDGIELFGGRVNMRYVVLTGNDDDSLDTDQGYQGFIQYVLALQREGGTAGDEIVEADSVGNEDALPRQWTRLANFTFVQRSSKASSAILLRGGTDYSAVNGIVVSPRACLDIDATGSTTTRPADAALQDQGPPLFRSVVFACAAGAYLNDGDVPVATIQAIFEASGANNNAAFISSLSGGFVNGINETVVIPFDASTLGSFLQKTVYIGAVRDANDLWYRGWTCDSPTAAFGSGKSCIAVP